MGKIIVNPKNYSGDELTNIFFRPMLSGPNAEALGIRVLYNMPVPTTVGFWRGKEDVLSPYAKGWAGANASGKFQKSIDLQKVKAEMSYSAADYFSMVYEKLACAADVNMGDLSGTALEDAETEIFKASITESIRATMWVGDHGRAVGFNTFDGILKSVKSDATGADAPIKKVVMPTNFASDVEASAKLFKAMFEAADARLRAMKAEGNLVMLVTREVMENYENSLLSGQSDSVRSARINGIESVQYRGVPVVDLQVDSYLAALEDLPKNFAIFTDRRNLTLAVNTRDLPGSEVAMWYNPDELENRQRAVFLAGADYLLPELIVASF